MQTSGKSLFASVIEDHLALKRKNAALGQPRQRHGVVAQRAHASLTLESVDPVPIEGDVERVTRHPAASAEPALRHHHELEIETVQWCTMQARVIQRASSSRLS